METAWDYTALAQAYLKRPEYSVDALNSMLALTNLTSGARVCDVGAGVAHLTIPLALRGFKVYAVEPNDEMRRLGRQRTAGLENVSWFEGVGEDTKQAAASFDLVTFGSSFNVVNRALALQEVNRVLRPQGWFAAMWNHRNLADPIQLAIENIIKADIPNYDYGTRRQDQTEIIRNTGLFKEVHKISGEILHSQTKEEIVEAWRSHATLARQAGAKFLGIIDKIAAYLTDLPLANILVPYTTNIWVAQLTRSA